ncbi:methyl-accepting chemotaxis protein [bacterium]|nr:methyl-accepting chemotaxis protein [bacterium]
MQWRRRNYIINKDFQFRYIGRVMFGIVVMALVIAFTVYYTTWVKIMDEFYNVPQIAAQFAPLFASVNQIMVLLLIIFMLTAAVISVFVSHSIAGPMYRFERSIEAIRAGDLTLNIGLRKGDEFKQLADLLNEMVQSLRSNLSTDRQMIEEMAGLISKIQKGGSSKSKVSPTLTKDLSKLSKILQQLQKDVQRFKLNH